MDKRVQGFQDEITVIGLEETGGPNDTIAIANIPDTVERIDNNAFRRWTALEKVSFSSGSQLNSIGIGAFWESGIKKFTAPDQLNRISQAAFHKCENLKCVIINDKLRNLGWNALRKDGQEI